MQIHALELTNFRAVEHLRLDELPERGVIVIHGENEAGKSTILDAIDLVLNQRHGSKRKEVKAVAPAGRDVGPEVQLTATVGDTTFTVHKRWMKSPMSELRITVPAHKNFSGREADDQLEHLLDQHLDRELAETLFLRQGELDPGLQAAGIASITAALEEESGTQAAGVEDTALMAAVEEEYARYWDARGKPKAAFTAKKTAADEAAEEHTRLRDQEAQLSRYVEEVARKQEEIAQAKAELPAAEEEVETREAEARQARELGERVEAAAETLRQATVTLTRAEGDVQQREALQERVTALRAEAESLAAQLEPAREAAETEGARLEELVAQREAAKKRVSDARVATKRAARVRDLVRARAELAAGNERLLRIAEAEKTYTELLEASPRRVVTDADIRAIEEAEAEVAVQQRLLEASAAKLDITATGATVVVDGEELAVDGTTSVGVFDGTELQFGDVTVVYRAAQGQRDPREAADEAKRELDELLEAVGCETLKEARDARDAHASHASALAGAKQRLDDVLAGSDIAALRSAQTALEATVEELEQELDTPADFSEAQAQEAVDAADAELAKAEQDAETAEAAAKPFADRKAAEALTVLTTRLEAKQSECADAQANLDAAETATTQDSLTIALETARAAVVEANATHESLAAQLADADPDTATLLLAGAKNRATSLQERMQSADKRIAELHSYIELAAGTAQRADLAEAKLEAATSELARTTRRAEAARLLRNTMVAHRDTARARYTAPFNEALRSHARVLFGPSVDFNFGDALDIVDRTVDGTTVALSELSGGTKEQLALLTRFAIADLVTATGDTAPVPVIVDDALGATDPERLTRMNLLFDQVGQKAQVFVLTCSPQRFDRVGAVRRYAMDEIKTQQS